MIVPFKFTGMTGGHKSVQFSSEVNRNLYMDLSESAERQGVHDFPGLKLIASGSGAHRGAHVMGDSLYLVSGSKLIRESSSGTRTTLGTVDGSARCSFADDGTNLFFVAGGFLFKWDGTGVSTVSQSVVAAPNSITYINKQFLISGANGRFAVSDVGDGSTYNALNFAEEETQPDGLLRVYAYSQLVYMFGSKTVGQWYNTGSGNPPFARRDTSLMNIGLAGTHAVTNTDQFLYWLGDDRKVYQCVGASARPVSTSGIAHIFESFTDVSDCIASTFTIDGQDFVLLSFPSAGATFCYSETYQYWVELSAGATDARQRWYADQVVSCYGKMIGIDYRNSNSYKLDLDTYTDNGDARRRVRVFPTFTAKAMQGSGQIVVSRVRINMEVGHGAVTGQGSDPMLMAELSPDGGKTWGAETFTRIGVLGQYRMPVDVYSFSAGYEVRLRLSFTDPCHVSFFDGEVELHSAGF